MPQSRESCRSSEARAAAGVAILLAFTACSSSSKGGPEITADPASRGVDTHEIEQLLVAKQKARSPDFDVRDPSCPARIVVAEGETFQCTVVVEGVIEIGRAHV